MATVTAAAGAACEVCDGLALTPAYQQLARCRDCGHVQYPEQPAEAPHALYQEAYFQEAEYLDYAAQQPTLAKNFRRCLWLMQRFGARSGRLFEVGCAYGFFLVEARRHFEVEGSEICAAAAAHARQVFGLRVTTEEFPRVPVPEPYDVVCLWDTVEHLFHPRAYLRKAHEALRSAGCLFLTTGDIGSLLARIQGPRWRLIHPPTHLHYFSKATITRLLTELGFRVEGIVKVGTQREIAGMIHQLSRFSKSPLIRRVAGKLATPARRIMGHADLYLNLYDIMFVAARKP